MFQIVPMTSEFVDGAVALQRLAFPPPFSEDLHWDREHLLIHTEIFPEGQFVALSGTAVIGSCSNTIITDERWEARENWYRTVGGPDLKLFNRDGTTLYGIDITVHPAFRKRGIGRAFYEARYSLVRKMGLGRYGTGCRIPDFSAAKDKDPALTVERYAEEVSRGTRLDRTMTPLLRYGLIYVGVVRNYMPDPESENAGALLEWFK